MDQRELKRQVWRIMADTQLIEEQIENAEKLNISKDHMQNTIKGIISNAEKLSAMIGVDMKNQEQTNHSGNHTSVENTVRQYTMYDEKFRG